MVGINWQSAFNRVKTRDGKAIHVVHTAWHLINVASTSHFGGCAVVDVLTSGGQALSGDTSAVSRMIPDCVLVRDSCKQAHGEDHSHQLHGFYHARVPCINSAHALLMCLERSVVCELAFCSVSFCSVLCTDIICT